MVIAWFDCEEVLSGNYHFGEFLKKSRMCFFSMSNTILAISQQWLARLMCNEKEVHRLDTGYNMKIKRKRINRILGRLYDLALWPHPWPWPWSFKFRVWNSLVTGMGRPIDMERKWCESCTGCGRMYRIVIRVTLDVGVPSIYLVLNGI